MAKHNKLGKKGEKEAVQYLLQKGYQILETNYRFRKFEIDIIAQKEGVIVAVEVKTRSSADFGNPQDFVKPAQIQRLVKALDHYIVSNSIGFEARFDIIAIIENPMGSQIEHLEDAFFHF